MFAKTCDDVSRGCKPIKHGQVVGLCFVVEFGLKNDIRNRLEYPICLTRALYMINTDLGIPASQVIICESCDHNVAPFCCLLLIRRLPTEMTRFRSALCRSVDHHVHVHVFWWFGEE